MKVLPSYQQQSSTVSNVTLIALPHPFMLFKCFVCFTHQLQKSYRNEYQILCQLPPHENVIHLYAFFYDRADPALCAEFRHLGPNVRSLSLFLLLEELPVSMKAHVDSLIANKGPQVCGLGRRILNTEMINLLYCKVGDVLRWFEDLLRGLVFLESHCVAHRDLKMDNLLLSRNGRVVIADFGKAIVLNNKMETPYMHGGCGQHTS